MMFSILPLCRLACIATVGALGVLAFSWVAYEIWARLPVLHDSIIVLAEPPWWPYRSGALLAVHITLNYTGHTGLGSLT